MLSVSMAGSEIPTSFAVPHIAARYSVRNKTGFYTVQEYPVEHRDASTRVSCAASSW